MNDELGGEIMREFVCPYQKENDIEKKAKCSNECVIV